MKGDKKSRQKRPPRRVKRTIEPIVIKPNSSSLMPILGYVTGTLGRFKISAQWFERKINKPFPPIKKEARE